MVNVLIRAWTFMTLIFVGYCVVELVFRIFILPGKSHEYVIRHYDISNMIAIALATCFIAPIAIFSFTWFAVLSVYIILGGAL